MGIMDIHRSYSLKMNLTRHICEIFPKNYWMNVIVSLGFGGAVQAGRGEGSKGV